jgi:enoyl-CoA hydratase/carnithine racemase
MELIAVQSRARQQAGAVAWRFDRDGMVNFQKIGYCSVIDITGVPEDESSCVDWPRQLAEVCEEIVWDEQVRVVVLAFDGKIDLQDFAVEQVSPVERVAKLKQPVIAAIRGDANGLGLELALACDIRIGTEGARFGLSQIRQGLMPSNGGTQRLPRLIGPGKAMQMVLTGDLIDAGEACRIGLINRVVPVTAVMSTAMEMAQDMAQKSPLSLSYSKEALLKGMDLTLDQGLRMELDMYLVLFSTSDRVEGITAFKEKRKPDFKGE